MCFHELRGEINGLEHQILVAEAEKDYWLQYKNVGSWEHAKQINHLQEEISDIKQNFSEIDEYFRKNLEKTKHDIDNETEKKMDQTREIATQDAVKHIDEESRREINENEWLKREFDIYKKDVQDLEVSVCKMEQENLQLINHLFDCRLHDLKIPRLEENCKAANRSGRAARDSTAIKAKQSGATRNVERSCSKRLVQQRERSRAEWSRTAGVRSRDQATKVHSRQSRKSAEHKRTENTRKDTAGKEATDKETEIGQSTDKAMEQDTETKTQGPGYSASWRADNKIKAIAQRKASREGVTQSKVRQTQQLNTN
ncbi:unnamed protein product [Ranitomeya imitator]|uniref:Uncharacterized protein n=1 Tax=Ranitomeya imitator TaxID=111125 RepID=A0ABN9LPB7_9NEOB|nr:unnamed protein product [Ranitomeya imitator]